MINMPGGPEIAVILVIALLVLGPQQLPKAMRTLGNAMAEIRKVSNGFQAEMRNAMDAIETQGGETSNRSTPSGPVAGSSSTVASAPDTPDVTEVVARNPGPESVADGVDAAEPAPAPVDPEPAGPAIDPADRAAG